MDEWASSAAPPEGQGNPHAMAGMEQGGSQGDHMANYDLVNVNGKAEEAIEPFPADNPGDWLFHCHDLHHASSGMVGTVNYEGYEPPKDIQMTDEDKPK